MSTEPKRSAGASPRESPSTSSSERPKAAPKALSGLLPYLRPYRLQLALAAAFLLLAAVAALLFPVALRYLIDSAIAPKHADMVAISVQNGFLGLFGVACALGLFSACRFYFVSWIGERITADVRSAVFAHTLRQSPEFFETTATGEVLSRLNADTTLLQTVVGSSLSMGLRNLVMGVGALGMLLVTNPRVMGTVLAVLGLIVLPSLWFGRRVRKLSRASQDRVADTSALAGELLNAAATVQTYTAEARETQRYAQATEAAFATAARRSRIRAALIAFIIVGTSAALLFGLYQGTQAVMAGRITPGHLGQTVVYVIILASAFAVLGEVYGDVQRAAGATERLMELLATESPVREPDKRRAEDSSRALLKEKAAHVGVLRSEFAINFESINFHYPSRPNTQALTDLSLHIEPGQTVALVGASGAGKSTVFQLLQRFYDPQSGIITLGGRDIKDLSFAELRGAMAVVAQDPVIFSANAADNIRYGAPTATDAQVHEAARAAFAHDFITALPEGYQTFLGERGVRLSGGQRQRIAIARAILKNAPILLLDEATSALDSESERMVQAALDNAMRGASADDHAPDPADAQGSPSVPSRITLVIAHRLATVQKADRIVVLDAGHIAEIGTHTELIARGGVYAGLAALQFNPDSLARQATLNSLRVGG